jgi:hypothetical protein
MRRFLLISLVPFVVACSGPTASVSAPSAPAPVVGGPASALSAPKTESQPAAKPAPQPASKDEAKPAETKPRATAPKATIAPPAENHGIALGQPFKSGANGSAVLVTNTTDQVMSFTVKTTYRKGDTSVELASRVSDLLPKQSRPAFAGGPKLVPADPDSISVAVTSVHAAAATTPRAEMQKKIKLSQPRPVEGSSSVTVEVTNTDETETFTVSLASAYIHDDDMVAHGEGQVLQLKPGETRTVKVRAVTSLKAYERVEVSISHIA